MRWRPERDAGREIVAGWRSSVPFEQRRLERCRSQGFEVAPTDFRVGILAGDHFALLGDADLALHGPGRLREDRLVARPTAPPDRTAAAMEQAQPDLVSPEDIDQHQLGLVELPGRGQVAAVLVAVGITQHHLLGTAARGEQPAIGRQAQELVHDPAAALQVADGLEQRRDVDIEPTLARAQQSHFLEQHRHFQDVGDTVGLGDHVSRHRGGAIAAVRIRHHAQHREFPGRFVAV